MATFSWQGVQTSFSKAWRRFRGLARWVQIVIGIVVVVILGGILVLARGGNNDNTGTSVPTVTLQSVDSFGDDVNGVEVVGTVQSVSEADLLAQSAGTVEAVNTTLGADVPAGFVIASLDGTAASASVLQAQGAYDAALAAERATNLQAQNSTGSLSDSEASVRTTYQSAYTGALGVLSTDVDVFFGPNTPVGPGLLINPLTTGDSLPRERRQIANLMTAWNGTLASEDTTDPVTLLTNAQTYLSTISSFLVDLSALASQPTANATPTQLADLAVAQNTINTLEGNVTASLTAYNTAQTANAVGQTQSSGGEGVTSSEASVEEALGGLRAAQAAFEKTVIRAPIAGTVNFLPITVGEYVTANEHVATVARNNALEVVMELSQDDANRLAVGNTVTIDNTYKGIVTTIAPALDPTTEQIEVEVAVDDGSDLVDGQSVQVALPALPTSGSASASTTSSTTNASSTPNIELPLTAVKLMPNERDVFSVDTTGHLVAHPVAIGDVIGDRIQILTMLPLDLMIVTDARGLSAGDLVQIASSTPDTGQ